MYCYTDFKLRYLNNLKLFSAGIKKLIEPIVLWKKKKKKKADGFLLFLKTLSSLTDLLVTLGDFMVKTQNLEGKFEYHFSRNCPKFHILTKIVILKVGL